MARLIVGAAPTIQSACQRAVQCKPLQGARNQYLTLSRQREAVAHRICSVQRPVVPLCEDIWPDEGWAGELPPVGAVGGGRPVGGDQPAEPAHSYMAL